MAKSWALWNMSHRLRWCWSKGVLSAWYTMHSSASLQVTPSALVRAVRTSFERMGTGLGVWSLNALAFVWYKKKTKYVRARTNVVSVTPMVLVVIVHTNRPSPAKPGLNLRTFMPYSIKRLARLLQNALTNKLVWEINGRDVDEGTRGHDRNLCGWTRRGNPTKFAGKT